MPPYALKVPILKATEDFTKKQAREKGLIISFCANKPRPVLVHWTKEHSKSSGLQHDIENFLTG